MELSCVFQNQTQDTRVKCKHSVCVIHRVYVCVCVLHCVYVSVYVYYTVFVSILCEGNWEDRTGV